MKKLVSLLVIISVLFSFSGCSVPEPKDEGSASAGIYPVTLTDHAGREVIIEEEPQRLISCYYITTSLLMALDLDGKLVGIENDPGLRPIYELSNPDLLELAWDPDYIILASSAKYTIGDVLNDPGLALNYCDRILLLHEGELLGCISPAEDGLNHMEALLSKVYGPVSLERIRNRSGRTRLVMLKEEDL